MQSVFHKLSNVLLLMCSHCINNSNCQWSWTPADRLLHCRLVLSILPFNNAKEGFGLTVHLLELKAFFVKTLWNFSHHAIILPQSSKRIMSNTKTKWRNLKEQSQSYDHIHVMLCKCHQQMWKTKPADRSLYILQHDTNRPKNISNLQIQYCFLLKSFNMNMHYSLLYRHIENAQ